MSLEDKMRGCRGDGDDEREGTTSTAIDEERVVGGHGAGASQ
jgi:hypothetical protein